MKETKSPSGGAYDVLSELRADPGTDEVSYSGRGYVCNDGEGDGVFVYVTPANNRQAAIAIGLENGTHCLNLQ